jgi:hypothetical protein
MLSHLQLTFEYSVILKTSLFLQVLQVLQVLMVMQVHKALGV